MQQAGWTRISATCAVVIICYWLTQPRICASGQTPLPAISGKIPKSVLKIIRTIRPGMTRAKFYKLFAPYTPGKLGHGSVRGGKSRRVYHYFYRLAYTNPVEVIRRRVIDSKVVFEVDERPDTTHWVFKELAIPSGTLIMIDVMWTYSKDGSSDDVVGNPDDVINSISKPYLIFDEGNHT